METQKYSDAELAEFKVLIESKLAKATEQLDQLQAEIVEITENSTGEHGGDWIDASSINNDVEMLNTMAIRQRKHIRDLENALIRIRNKTYGICIVTGLLIDKKRLMAVPTTSKSLSAKNAEMEQAKEKTKSKLHRIPPKMSKTPVIISKKISKPSGMSAPKAVPVTDDDEDEDLFVNEPDEMDDSPHINLDDLIDESSLDGDDDF